MTNQVLEDREGNIWIGTEKGLDKFRPATLRAEPVLTAPAAFGDKLMLASDGSVYIGEATDHLPRQARRRARADPARCPGTAEHLRGAGRGDLDRVRNAHPRLEGGPDTLGDRPVPHHDTVYDCAFDARRRLLVLRWRPAACTAIGRDDGKRCSGRPTPTASIRRRWFATRKGAWSSSGIAADTGLDRLSVARRVVPLEFRSGRPRGPDDRMRTPRAMSSLPAPSACLAFAPGGFRRAGPIGPMKTAASMGSCRRRKAIPGWLIPRRWCGSARGISIARFRTAPFLRPSLPSARATGWRAVRIRTAKAPSCAAATGDCGSPPRPAPCGWIRRASYATICRPTSRSNP